MLQLLSSSSHLIDNQGACTTSVKFSHYEVLPTNSRASILQLLVIHSMTFNCSLPYIRVQTPFAKKRRATKKKKKKTASPATAKKGYLLRQIQPINEPKPSSSKSYIHPFNTFAPHALIIHFFQCPTYMQLFLRIAGPNAIDAKPCAKTDSIHHDPCSTNFPA